jgi:CheY-like chemotaxis protein
LILTEIIPTMKPSVPKKPRILIAEDVNVIALIMTRALEKAGFSVEVARDGLECLHKALACPPDLVVLDMILPKMNGIEVLQALRTSPSTQKLDVLVCSAKDFKTERELAARLGAVDYLIKSSDPAVLVQKVQSVLGRGNVSGSGPTIPGKLIEIRS